MWLIETVSTEGVTPKTCGQFVDRILSTAEIVADNEWERSAKPSKLVVAATFEMAKT